jgi:hypothetical protein
MNNEAPPPPVYGFPDAPDTWEERKGWYVSTYLQSPHWKTMRRVAKKLLGNTCALCGRAERLAVHHRHYETLGDEHPLHDLLVLCFGCHKGLVEPVRKAHKYANGNGGREPRIEERKR